jgi:mannose-6-phosphate isomerase-like protein (cupin superfamily)
MPWGHRHREQEEAYVVVGGSGRARLDDEIVELAQWDVLRLAPEVVRSSRPGRRAWT